MIEIQAINPLSLPSVLLEKSQYLPTTSCIYFAIDSNNVVQYIGRSQNLKSRWSSHQRYGQLKRMGGIRIAYIEIFDHSLLPEIEIALIKHFNPPLNISHAQYRPYQKTSLGYIKIRRYTDIEVEGIGAKIKQARKASGRPVELLAGEAGISRAYWHDIEAERVRDALPEDTLRRIEKVLNVDFGVKFND
jgi:GIY-YIG catalytic domain